MKTRKEAIAAQKNSVIRKALERMSDEQYTIHRAGLERDIASGAVAREAARLALEVYRSIK